MPPRKQSTVRPLTEDEGLALHRRLFAEQMLTWCADSLSKTDSRYRLPERPVNISPLEWLRKLTEAEFEFLLVGLEQEVRRRSTASLEAILPEIANLFGDWHTARPRAIKSPEETQQWRQMLDYEKSFVQDGIRFFPLSAATSSIQAPAPTILHWIKNDTKFNGKPLQSFYFPPANQYFISEDSVKRAANRFILWPSRQPAGSVRLGHMKDKNGFIPLSEAERILGVSKRTMYLWATQGSAPSDKQPEVIQCPSSEHFYIRERDVYAIKKSIPRSGLPRGRRRRLPSLHS